LLVPLKDFAIKNMAKIYGNHAITTTLFATKPITTKYGNILKIILCGGGEDTFYME
jgi:hypothetical protein